MIIEIFQTGNEDKKQSIFETAVCMNCIGKLIELWKSYPSFKFTLRVHLYGKVLNRSHDAVLLLGLYSQSCVTTYQPGMLAYKWYKRGQDLACTYRDWFSLPLQDRLPTVLITLVQDYIPFDLDLLEVQVDDYGCEYFRNPPFGYGRSFFDVPCRKSKEHVACGALKKKTFETII